MNTNQLKRFAKEARIKLLDQIGRKLDYVLTQDAALLRGKEKEISQLKQKVQQVGKTQVVETVAYTWFNRLMALRFMDANGYNLPRVVTPLPGMSNPEILQNALAGSVDTDLQIDRARLNTLLDGKAAVADGLSEAYKLLLVASCNHWHRAMPFMFERISDYSELLLPDDLLSDYGIVADIRQGMSDADCQQEELIGWLYQFYIADKKDEVFNGLKKNIKISAENIPAATQLFTPRWIVRYLVENTLGKLWLSLKPQSKLREHMPYYIEAPADNPPAPIPAGIQGVTDIRFIDPCQGSGHVLVYAFDLFVKIYEEEGYNNNEIPALILKHNLYGIDIDPRAAQLAAFALTMKARNYYSRFLRKPVQPQVLALENIAETTIQEAVPLPVTLNGQMVLEHSALSLHLLTQADNLGSLIQINPAELALIQVQPGSIWQSQQEKLRQQAALLSRKYHCVVTNPPYMGSGGMNDRLKRFLEFFYPLSKSDLMTCFMDRCGSLIDSHGYYGMINLPSWLFITSFEGLRKELLKNYHIHSLLHMGRGIFGIDFGSVAFVISKSSYTSGTGSYFRLHQRNFQHIYYYHIEQLFLRAKENHAFKYNFNEYRGIDGVSEIPNESNINGIQLLYNANQDDFKKIPGVPFSFWAKRSDLLFFEKGQFLADLAKPSKGMMTGDNPSFVRFHWEINKSDFAFNVRSHEESLVNPLKWYIYFKGGPYRKWYGNKVNVVNFQNDGQELKQSLKYGERNPSFYFKNNINWTKVSSTSFAARIGQEGALYDDSACQCLVDNSINLEYILGFLNTKISISLLGCLSITLNFSPGEIARIPIVIEEELFDVITKTVKSCTEISKQDWDAGEVSLNFQYNHLIQQQQHRIKLSFELYTINWTQKFHELHHNEEELNRQFIELYGLQDELSPEVPLEEITILQEEARIIDGQLHIDPVPVLLQLISYSIGCMFGRYSLDQPGLILANQGETLADYLQRVPQPSFTPDEDNIIPVLEGEWFGDDIVGRFRAFLRAAFGPEHFEENLKYIEDTLGKDIRRYLVKDFYTDHLKRYKKRPIYWMFSSAKGHFKALIYLHRYQPDLCSKLLNDYLQAYISKLESSKQNQAQFVLREDISAREKSAAQKEIDKLDSMLKDCRDYEKTVFAVATQKIALDLDDGVKVNYQKFKDVLVPIKGLDKEEA